MKKFVWIFTIIMVTYVIMCNCEKTKLRRLKRRVAALESQSAAFESKFAALEKKLDECCDSSSSEFSAFSAYSNKTQFLKRDDIVKFKTTLVNKGQDYNTTESIYRCPVEGYYLFTFTINSFAMGVNRNTTRAHATLYIGDRPQIEVLSYNSDPNNYIITSSSNTALFFCKKKNRVFVKAYFGENAAWSLPGYARTTFSGFLIQKSTEGRLGNLPTPPRQGHLLNPPRLFVKNADGIFNP